ncbi:MAG: hypothetical protein KF729_17460 [Sandaracinaceae bacterium]|nr:hypothetical protein [Sandaracinaceae bacterium]
MTSELWAHGRVAWRLGALLLAGCGAIHSAGDVDSGVARSDSAVSDAGAPPRHCVDLCEARRARLTSGHCPFETFSESGRCEDRCAEVAEMSAATRAAFEGCVWEDPLCFQSIDTCVYARRYPEPTAIPATASAEGLDAHDGRPVIVALDSSAGSTRREVVVVGGRFEVRFEEPLHAAWPPSFLGFIDVDGDGRCDSDTDVAFYERPLSVGTFDAPAYRAHLVGPPDRDFGFVCDSL